MRPIFFARNVVAALLACLPATGGVVLNEIFYHAPDDLDALQWIELHNPDATPANLAGWRFSKGIEFTFPAGTSLDPGGFPRGVQGPRPVLGVLRSPPRSARSKNPCPRAVIRWSWWTRPGSAWIA